VKWAVAPTGACSVVGKMWKCDKCYVPNPWEQAKCLARASLRLLWPRLLGTTSCPETPGVELRERAGSDKQLDESAFVDWYVRMIFATDEDGRGRGRGRAGGQG
jgi:hypothetical protein